jgi:Immunity protein 74
MTISGEMLMDGFAIYVASIVTWDDSHGELIDEAERQRIVKNVKASLESQGANVVLE